MLTTKFAIGEIDACHPLDGLIYGSAGLITQLFAIGDGGGKLKTDHLLLSIKAVAILARSVDMAAISPASILGLKMGQAIREHEP